MEKQLGKEYAHKELRVKFLKDNCDAVEEIGYMKHFSEDQLVQMKEELSTVAIKTNKVRVERKRAMDEFKEELKPLVKETERLLLGLDQKAEAVHEICYKFIDVDTKQVGYYNEEGDLVSIRAAFGNELQTNIFQVEKKAV